MEGVSMFWMYIIAMLPDIGNFFSMFMVAFWLGLAITFLAVLIMSLGCWLECKEETVMKRLKLLLRNKFIMMFFAATFTLGSASYFVPSYQQLAFIVGGHWAINNEDLREMPDNVAKIVNGYLEEINEGLEE